MIQIFGYHATTVEAAQLICEHKFQLPYKDHHWLGQGLYFFQDAPYRAWEWAREEVWDVKHGHSSPAVVCALIDFDAQKSIDLLDARWCDVLRENFRAYLRYCIRAGRRTPQQTGVSRLLKEHGVISGEAHRLDCDFIDTIVPILQAEGFIIQAVRAAFSEGRPIFPTSHLFHRAHVQIAVRPQHFSMIRKLHQLPKL